MNLKMSLNQSEITHPLPVPPLEGEGNFLSLRERIKPALREFEGVRVGIFIILYHDSQIIPGISFQQTGRLIPFIFNQHLDNLSNMGIPKPNILLLTKTS